MEIISFTGKSGTGKSFQATNLCMKMNIDAIVDDGLLIYKGRVVAGSSAKRAKTKAAAMRTCLFNYEDNRIEVRDAIRKYNPERLMIIGTSDRMVDIIAEALELHEADQRIYIEDVSSEEDRAKASYSRNVKGEHVVPAPIGELKRSFAGYFMNPLKFIRNFGMQEASPYDDGSESLGEAGDGRDYDNSRDRTVVRPQFSYSGTYKISEKVIKDIVDICSDDYADSLSVLGCMQAGSGMDLGVTVDVRAIITEDTIDKCREYQKSVHDAIEQITSFMVSRVNIRIKDTADNEEDLHSKRFWQGLI